LAEVPLAQSTGAVASADERARLVQRIDHAMSDDARLL